MGEGVRGRFRALRALKTRSMLEPFCEARIVKARRGITSLTDQVILRVECERTWALQQYSRADQQIIPPRVGHHVRC